MLLLDLTANPPTEAEPGVWRREVDRSLLEEEELLDLACGYGGPRNEERGMEQPERDQRGEADAKDANPHREATAVVYWEHAPAEDIDANRNVSPSQHLGRGKPWIRRATLPRRTAARYRDPYRDKQREEEVRP